MADLGSEQVWLDAKGGPGSGDRLSKDKESFSLAFSFPLEKQGSRLQACPQTWSWWISSHHFRKLP